MSQKSASKWRGMFVDGKEPRRGVFHGLRRGAATPPAANRAASCASGLLTHDTSGILSGALSRIASLVAALSLLVAMVALPGCATYAPAAYNIEGAPQRGTPPSGPGRLADGAAQTSSRDLIEGPFDEVWVIAKSHPSIAAKTVSTPARALPGTGSLYCADDGSDPLRAPRAFPLQQTTVSADIAGPVASVRVDQLFANPFAEKIEAVYAFPLPHDAAINDFLLTIGDRRIRGVIREREQAQRLYADARRAGYVASMLEEERDNIFEERVANLEPGRTIEVSLTFVNTARYVDDAWEWRFPMVISPRFNPPCTPDQIRATAVGGATAVEVAPIDWTHSTTIEYLRDGQRSGADIDLQVSLDAGAPLRTLESPSHSIEFLSRAESTATLRLAPHDRIPNRDFVLRYGCAGPAPTHSLVTSGPSPGAPEGALLLSILPPRGVRQGPRAPMEVIFILDTSGSMAGPPFGQLQDAVDAALARLAPQDSFQIVTFNNGAAAWGNEMVAATPITVSAAREYVARLSAGGGTMMLPGLRTALALPHASERVRTLIFITDGLLSNESEILREIHFAAGRDRVFALGVGKSVNWSLLSGMGRVGNGAVAALRNDESAAYCMNCFMDRLSAPVAHSLTISFEGGSVHETAPSRLNDLVAGSPVTVLAKYSGELPRRAILHGYIGDQEMRVPLDLAAAPQRHPAVECLWARQRLADISQEAIWGDQLACHRDMENLALANNLVSPFTSFVAVDASRTSAGEAGTTVVQPTVMPEGMSYDNTVAPPRR